MVWQNQQLGEAVLSQNARFVSLNKIQKIKQATKLDR